MKALKLMVAFAIAATASVSFASACNQQVSAKMFDKTAKPYAAAAPKVVPTSQSKANGGRG
ncbi:hypothetical protein [Bdellovibrio sp. HCB288]|uniref:hypothetical protein n=1 Tax=Bdellovibrio sp. HCB288 TaxID=3394355 RepID=UPI0039B5F843